MFDSEFQPLHPELIVEKPTFRINFIPENSDELISILKLIKKNSVEKGLNISEYNNIDFFEILDKFNKYTISLLLGKNELPYLQIMNYRIDYNGIDELKTKYIPFVDMYHILDKNLTFKIENIEMTKDELLKN